MGVMNDIYSGVASALKPFTDASSYKYKIQVFDKGNATLYKLEDVTTNITIQSERVGSASVLNLEFILDELKAPEFEEGATIMVDINNIRVFGGFIFSISRDRWGVCRLTAYDSIRYLKNAVMIFEKAGYDGNQIMINAAKQCGITLSLEITSDYRWASKPYIEYSKPALDVIMEVLNRSVSSGNTSEAYTMRADYTNMKKVSIAPVITNVKPLVLGENSMMTDISVERSIDNEWCNSYLLVFDQGTSDIPKAGREIRNEVSIKKRGLIRKVMEAPQGMFLDLAVHKFGAKPESTDPKDVEATSKAMTDTMNFMEELARKSFKFYNKIVYHVRFDCLGYLGLRAGDMVKIAVSGLGITDVAGKDLANLLLLESVTHQISEGKHTMSIEGKIDVVEEGQPIAQDYKG